MMKGVYCLVRSLRIVGPLAQLTMHQLANLEPTVAGTSQPFCITGVEGLDVQ